MKQITILGATGSIGKSVCAVVDQFPQDIRITGVSAHSNIDALGTLVAKYRPSAAAVLDEQAGARFAHAQKGATDTFTGAQGLLELVSRSRR